MKLMTAEGGCVNGEFVGGMCVAGFQGEKGPRRCGDLYRGARGSLNRLKVGDKLSLNQEFG